MSHREARSYPTKEMGTSDVHARKPWVVFIGKGQDQRKGDQIGKPSRGEFRRTWVYGSIRNNRERTWTKFETHQKLVVR